MQKRFILLIDFSEYSSNLIRYAASWAEQINAELVLVHQAQVVVPSMADLAVREQILAQTKSDTLFQLQKLATPLINNSLSVEFRICLHSMDKCLDGLLAVPSDQLVFVGLKGTGALRKLFIGSVALNVIENSDKPVVAIPKEISHFSHERIFVAVSDKHRINVLALHHLLSFIHPDNTKVTFFSMTEEDEVSPETEQQLMELVRHFSTSYSADYKIFTGANVFEDIKTIINNRVEELLVVQKGSRYLSDQLFRRFLINELAYEGQTPMVVLP